MYQNVSEYYGDAIAGPNRTFNMKLSENGIDIVDSLKSIQITAGFEEITIGSAVSTYFDATIEKQSVTLSGKEITLQAGIEINGKIEYIPMGIYTIQNPRVQGNTISFTAYDRLTSRCNSGYFSKITYPADALDVLSEIESMTGITVDKTGLSRGIQISKRAIINEDSDSEDDTVITSYVNPFDGYTYKEAVGFIAGLFGKFAVCGRTGNIEFRWYTETGYTITADTFYNDFEESEEGFLLGRLECDSVDQTLVSGAGTTGISFSNPVMTQGTLDNVFLNVKDLTFTPGMVRFIGDLRLDLGDVVTVLKNDGTEFKVPTVHLLTAYDGGLMQSITSVGNTEEEDDADSKGPITETVERVSYELAFIKTLMVDNFTATNGTVKNLSGDFLNFKTGEFETLKAQQANFENATAENFTAVRAEIDNILIGNLDADYARIDFANIDTAKIRQGFMENLMVSQGIFTSDITAAEGTFTNYLTGVNILANNITAGTLSVERLVITGSDQSIVYEINKANGTPQLSQSTVDGGALTERTVTADRIVAESITGNEIAATTITGQHILGNTITADKLAANTITADSACISSINANKITSGTLSADRIDVKGLFAKDITATGTIRGMTIVGGTISGVDINGAENITGNTLNVSGAQVNRDIACLGNISSNGTISSGGNINISGTNFLTGNGVALIRFTGTRVGVGDSSREMGLYASNIFLNASVFRLNPNDSTKYLNNSGNARLGYLTMDGNVNMQHRHYLCGKTSGGTNCDISGIGIGGNDSVNCVYLGNTSLRTYLRGASVRLKDGTAVTSNLEKKHDVYPLENSKYEDMFNHLNPVSYKLNDGDSGRDHLGFGAQHVVEAIRKAGLTTQEYGAVIIDYVDGQPVDYCLRYEEFIALNTHMIQKTRKDLDYQVGRIDIQQAIINNLQSRLWQAEKEIKELKQAAQ